MSHTPIVATTTPPHCSAVGGLRTTSVISSGDEHDRQRRRETRDRFRVADPARCAEHEPVAEERAQQCAAQPAADRPTRPRRRETGSPTSASPPRTASRAEQRADVRPVGSPIAAFTAAPPIFAHVNPNPPKERAATSASAAVRPSNSSWRSVSVTCGGRITSNHA
jgi:hypothetical protein